MDETISREPMALKVVNKTPGVRRMLCNALIQPHFDYACSVWHLNLNARLKKTCK